MCYEINLKFKRYMRLFLYVLPLIQLILSVDCALSHSPICWLIFCNLLAKVPSFHIALDHSLTSSCKYPHLEFYQILTENAYPSMNNIECLDVLYVIDNAIQ